MAVASGLWPGPGQDDPGGWRLDVVETANFAKRRTLPTTEGTDTIHCLEFTPDNRHLALSYYKSLAEVIDVQSGRAVATFRGHGGRVIGVSVTADARLVATCATDGTVRLWDGRTGNELDQFAGSWEEYKAVAFSPDGSRLAASAAGIDLWDLNTRRQVLVLRTPDEWSFFDISSGIEGFR